MISIFHSSMHLSIHIQFIQINRTVAKICILNENDRRKKKPHNPTTDIALQQYSF